MCDVQQSAVKAALIADGWSFDRIVPSATLTVATAAGERTAIASLVIPGSVHWDYVSEGRNILSASTTYLPTDATAEQVSKLLTKALSQVRKQIDDSYARRLYLNAAGQREMLERKELLDSIRAQLHQGRPMVIADDDYIWFIRPDGNVRWMPSKIEEDPRNRLYWHSSVGTIVSHLLAKAQVLPADDSRILEYQATLPNLRAWLKS